MNILVVSDSLRELAPAVTALEASGHRIAYVDALLPLPEVAARGLDDLSQVEALVTGRLMWLDAEALALLPRARVIALHTSGSDNVDLPEATRRGIVVTNVKGVNAEQCAEFSVGLLLAVTRQIRTGDIAIREGLWASRTQTSLDLYGATVGIVGLGLIGRAAVRRLRAFGVRLLCHTRTPDPVFADEMGMTTTDLDTLLRESDVVSLYASLTEHTRHMIGARELGLMKPSATLINIARGELIDEPALIEALRTRRIAGAGLDVFETEPLHDSPLFALDNVVLTPHQAGLAASAKVNAAVRAVTNALAALGGRLPPDAINPEAFRSP
ncbi:MAG TPA: NAD(P)-dependent oxidoreductase [Rubellimicrobium sp.]|nr:NAD(P)-dependent oxidoreductase [Rubellimicrobium sp.]